MLLTSPVQTGHQGSLPTAPRPSQVSLAFERPERKLCWRLQTYNQVNTIQNSLNKKRNKIK